MNKPSVTDWIQAIAVVIGVGFAIWEFVLHDRVEETNKKATVRDLMSQGQSDSILAAYQELFRVTKQFRAGVRLTDDEWFNFQLKVAPLKEHYLAWSYCYSSELCDRELVLEAVCFRAKTYEKFMEQLRPLSSDPDPELREHYILMLDSCDSYGT